MGIAEVAARAGSSPTAVSLVLNGKGGRYSAATRDRIIAAARELGYRPSASARAVVTGRHAAITLLLSPTRRTSHLPIQLLEGIEAALAERDLHLVVARLPDIDDAEATQPKWLRQTLCDGHLVLWTHQVPPALDRILADAGAPAVWINRYHARDAVHPDDAAATAAATAACIALGHRRIAWGDCSPMQGAAAHPSQTARRDGCLRALRGAQLPAATVEPAATVPFGERIGWWRDRLREPGRPTAIITGSISTAEPLAVAALSLGMELGRDLSITTVGDEPRLTAGLEVDTWVLPWRALAAAAVERLCARVDGGGRSASIVLPCTHAAGATLAPPRSEDPS